MGTFDKGVVKIEHFLSLGEHFCHRVAYIVLCADYLCSPFSFHIRSFGSSGKYYIMGGVILSCKFCHWGWGWRPQSVRIGYELEVGCWQWDTKC